MLPDETKVVKDSEKQCMFTNKHSLYEYFNFLKNEGYYIKQNFSYFNQKTLKGFQSDNILWNVFTKDDVGFRQKDYTFTMKVK